MQEFDIDKMLTIIRDASNSTQDTYSKGMLSTLRKILMKGDVEYFWIAYENYSSMHTDIFDHAVDLMFDAASSKNNSINTIDQLVAYCAPEQF